ncbi:MAG: hypothetical protein LBQ26_02330 [Holosporales bacterium]|jgi:multidrug transporter EmrE-like cation transporter|nr:hypothetical protein [Holosporales bacterium]
MTSSLYLSIIVQICISVFGQVFFKKNAGRIIDTVGDVGFYDLLWAFATDPRMVIGLFLSGTGTLMWFYLLIRAEISFLYPIAHAITYILLIFSGWYFLEEVISPLRLVGVLVILIGVGIVSRT